MIEDAGKREPRGVRLTHTRRTGTNRHGIDARFVPASPGVLVVR